MRLSVCSCSIFFCSMFCFCVFGDSVQLLVFVLIWFIFATWPKVDRVHTKGEPTFLEVVWWGLAANTQWCCSYFLIICFPSTRALAIRIWFSHPLPDRFRYWFGRFVRLWRRLFRFWVCLIRSVGTFLAGGIGWVYWWRCWSWGCLMIFIFLGGGSGRCWNPEWGMFYGE